MHEQVKHTLWSARGEIAHGCRVQRLRGLRARSTGLACMCMPPRAHHSLQPPAYHNV